MSLSNDVDELLLCQETTDGDVEQPTRCRLRAGKFLSVKTRCTCECDACDALKAWTETELIPSLVHGNHPRTSSIRQGLVRLRGRDVAMKFNVTTQQETRMEGGLDVMKAVIDVASGGNDLFFTQKGALQRASTALHSEHCCGCWACIETFTRVCEEVSLARNSGANAKL